MLFMITEHFEGGDPVPVCRRRLSGSSQVVLLQSVVDVLSRLPAERVAPA